MAITITVNAPKVKREISVSYEGLGNTLAESIDLHGEEVCHVLIRRMVETDIKNGARSLLNKNATDEQIREWVSKYRPGIINRSGIVTPGQALEITLQNLDNLTEEELQTLLERAQAIHA